MTNKTTKNDCVHRNRWRRFTQFLLCFLFLTSFFPATKVSANGECDCDSSMWYYTRGTNGKHQVNCDDCGSGWQENCSYDSKCDVSCSVCGYSRVNAHSYKYTYENDEECSGICTLCGETTLVNHKWVYTETAETPTRPPTITATCYRCLFSVTSEYSHPAFDDFFEDLFKDSHAADDSGLNSFTWNIYKAIRNVCVPMAILSFASCGYKFLGSIFFGNFASPVGGDMEKAKKQFFWTFMAILFIILLPQIFGAAINFFEDTAWNP